jgi:hypothetical protein
VSWESHTYAIWRAAGTSNLSVSSEGRFFRSGLFATV